MAKYYIFIGLCTAIFFGTITLVFTSGVNPIDARARSLDQTRILDFQTLRSLINEYYLVHARLPQDLAELSSIKRLDPETKKEYDYNIEGTSFKLCTTFSTSSYETEASVGKLITVSTYPVIPETKHKKGYDCLKFTIPITTIVAPPLPPMSSKKVIPIHSQPLIGYWNFDDNFGATLHDTSGNLVDGTVFGLKGESWKKNGECVKGGCVEFDGSASFADFGNPDIYQLDKNLSISAWVYPEKISSESQLIFGSGQPGTSGGYKLYIGPNNSLVLWTQAYQVSSLPATKLENGKWYHVVATIDDRGKSGTLYINGKLESSGEVSVTPFYGPVTMGKDPASQTQYFKGRLDEVKLYNKILTSDEVTRLYTFQ